MDICNIGRFQKMPNIERFIDKYFSLYERQYVTGSSGIRYERVAGIFAAKEAFVKALGTGFREFDLQCIEIRHKETGSPYFQLSGWAEDESLKRKIFIWYLSITHDGDTAAAVSVAEA